MTLLSSFPDGTAFLPETGALNKDELIKLLAQLAHPGFSLTPVFLIEHCPNNQQLIMQLDKKARKVAVISLLIDRFTSTNTPVQTESVASTVTEEVHRPVISSSHLDQLIEGVTSGAIDINDAFLDRELPAYTHLIMAHPESLRRGLVIHHLEIKKRGGTRSTFEETHD